MADYICNHGSMSIAVDASTWQTYTGGIMNAGTCGNSIDHAVTLVGLDQSKNAWIVRNSWGNGWGVSATGEDAPKDKYSNCPALVKSYGCKASLQDGSTTGSTCKASCATGDVPTAGYIFIEYGGNTCGLTRSAYAAPSAKPVGDQSGGGGGSTPSPPSPPSPPSSPSPPADDGKTHGSHACVNKKSVAQCAKCMTGDQCENGYCCPYMKKCVATSQTRCGYPIAKCRPMCYDSMAPSSCAASCTSKDFPYNWAGETCSTPTPPSPTPPAPTPPSPKPSPRPSPKPQPRPSPKPSPTPSSCKDKSQNCPYYAKNYDCSATYAKIGALSTYCCKSCGGSGPASTPEPTPEPTEAPDSGYDDGYGAAANSECKDVPAFASLCAQEKAYCSYVQQGYTVTIRGGVTFNDACKSTCGTC